MAADAVDVHVRGREQDGPGPVEGRPEERVGARVVSERERAEGEETCSDRCPLYIIQPYQRPLSLCMLLGLMKLPRQSLHVINDCGSACSSLLPCR